MLRATAARTGSAPYRLNKRSSLARGLGFFTPLCEGFGYSRDLVTGAPLVKNSGGWHWRTAAEGGGTCYMSFTNTGADTTPNIVGPRTLTLSTTAWTMAIWACPGNTATIAQNWFFLDNTSTHRAIIQVTSNTIRGFVVRGGSNVALNSGIDARSGGVQVLKHAALVCRGAASHHLYVNGGAPTSNTSTNAGTNQVALAPGLDGDAATGDRYMKFAAIWPDRALSGEEVRWLADPRSRWDLALPPRTLVAMPTAADIFATGALAAAEAEIDGVAAALAAAAGALAAGVASADGAAAVFLAAIGDLQAGDATIEGVADRIEQAFATGDLQAGDATIEGAAAVRATAVGLLAAGDAVTVGEGGVLVKASGELEAEPASIVAVIDGEDIFAHSPLFMKMFGKKRRRRRRDEDEDDDE